MLCLLRCHRYYSRPADYSDIYGEWQVVALPSLLVSQMGVLPALQSAITCNGSQLSSTAVVTSSGSSSMSLAVSGPPRIQQSMNALSDFYTSTTAAPVNFQFSAKTSPKAMNWSQQTGGLSFLYLDEIPATTAINRNQYLALPSLITGVSLIYNYQLSPTVLLNSSMQLVMDFNAIVRIVAGNITSFYDPAILALNPGLIDALDGAPAPIIWTFGCLLSPAGSPLYSALGSAVSQLRYVQPSILAALALLTTSSYGRAVGRVVRCQAPNGSTRNPRRSFRHWWRTSLDPSGTHRSTQQVSLLRLPTLTADKDLRCVLVALLACWFGCAKIMRWMQALHRPARYQSAIPTLMHQAVSEQRFARQRQRDCSHAP